MLSVMVKRKCSICGLGSVTEQDPMGLPGTDHLPLPPPIFSALAPL